MRRNSSHSHDDEYCDDDVDDDEYYDYESGQVDSDSDEENSKNKDENVEEDDSDDNQKFKLIFIFTVVGLLIFGVWLLHRESRPDAVDFLLSPLDESLESQQKSVDFSINSVKKWLGFRKTKSNVSIIKKFTKETAGKRSSIQWQSLCNEISLALNGQNRLLEQRKSELELLRADRRNLLKNGQLQSLNEEIRRIFGRLKVRYEGRDFVAVGYRNLYNVAMIKALVNDIQHRTELIERIKTYTRNNRGTTSYAHPSNLFLKTSGVELDAKKLSRIVGNDGAKPVIPVNFFNEFRFRAKEWEIMTPPEIGSTQNEQMTKYLNELGSNEQELYELIFRNINYYDQFNEAFSQHRIYEQFVDELRGEINVKRLREHLKRQEERIGRLKIFWNPKVSQIIKADLYHKRKLMTLFTSGKMINYDRRRLQYREYQQQFYEKLTGWFEKNLEMKKRFNNVKDYYTYMFRVLSDRPGTDVTLFNLANGLSVMRYVTALSNDNLVVNTWNSVCTRYFLANYSTASILQDGLVISIVRLGRLLTNLPVATYNSINVNAWGTVASVSGSSRSFLDEIKEKVMKNVK